MSGATQSALSEPVDGGAAARAAERLAAGAETVYDAFVAAAEEHPELPFLCVPAREGRAYHALGVEITYGEAAERVAERAALYQSSGYGPGHRVALMLDNRPEHFFNQLALYSLGVSQVPVNPDYLDHELLYLLEHSEAAVAVGHESSIERLSRVAAELGIEAVLDGETISLPKLPASREPVSRATEAALIYTSGTTGRPKGCVIDHEYHFAVGLTYARHGGRLSLLHKADRLFVPLPVFHVNAGINTLTALILTGNCLILPDRFHPGSWWRDITETRATAMHYLGVIPPILLKEPPRPDDRAHTLRFGLGAGLDPEIHRTFEERFGIPMVEVWGMTETGRFVADCHEPRRIRTRAFGRALHDLDVKVVDDDGAPVSPGAQGELVVRAPGADPRHGFFRGYLKDPDATAEAWRGGWFHTGDVVTQEPDGMLHFVERRKNIIRRSGENISAAEVENALIGHPAVDAVAVIGVVDELRDEEVMACVLPASNVALNRETALEIHAHARSLVAYYKAPGWIAFVEELPRTGTQKVRKGLIFPGVDDPRQAMGVWDLRDLKKRDAQR